MHCYAQLARAAIRSDGLAINVVITRTFVRLYKSEGREDLVQRMATHGLSALNDLAAFAVVAEEESFTRAASRLGMSQPALSHAMKGLEERLKVRLLARTTRSVSTTEAGDTLLRSLRPALEDIAAGLAKVGALGGGASGTVRLTATKNAVTAVVVPVLPAFLASHPDVRVELIVDDNLTDIVANRFDAGIRFGHIVEKDMMVNNPG